MTMLVATVTALRRPAWATIAASRAWFFAFSTSCGTPARTRRLLSSSDLATDAVPSSTGWPASCRATTSATTASNLASSVR